MRLTSLDTFRGIAIAGMILVNNPGSWSYVYPPLLHAQWHGFTPTDLVFPAFLYIVGVAMAFSLARYTQAQVPITGELYWRIIRRGLILFALGLLLNGFPTYDLSSIRIMGVLQRISIAYVITALLVLHLRRWQQWLLTVIILLGYWATMTLIPVPGFGAGDLSQDGNFAAYLDRIILGTAHLYKQAQFDPEGLFSTLPAIATVLIGYFNGHWLRTQAIQFRTTIGLVLFGIGCLCLGWAWGLTFPINKQLWTSSFVLYSAGWSTLLLALCYELIEVRGKRSWGWFFEVMGLNAIFLFVASGFVVRILYRIQIGAGEETMSAYSWIYETLFRPWAGDFNGSLLFAIANVVLWWLILYFMYRRHWFVKV